MAVPEEPLQDNDSLRESNELGSLRTAFEDTLVPPLELGSSFVKLHMVSFADELLS